MLAALRNRCAMRREEPFKRQQLRNAKWRIRNRSWHNADNLVPTHPSLKSWHKAWEAHASHSAKVDNLAIFKCMERASQSGKGHS